MDKKYFHGTSKLFDSFDLSQTFSGTGRAKFGFGVYLTESYETAAHYAIPSAPEHYVYTVQCPAITTDNHLVSALPVNPDIVARTEQQIGCIFPEEVTAHGKYFRKYIGNLLTSGKGDFKKASVEAEQAAAEFLLKIGVGFNVWPQAQTKPDGLKNIAVFNPGVLLILKIEQVDLDSKGHLVPGSAKTIQL